MKLDLQSLSAEPLIYMLMHSGAFVTVLGLVFFMIGLLFGRATWGKYMRQTQELRTESAALKEEIADLKRKLGELAVRPGPSVGIITETLTMPPREPAPTPHVQQTISSHAAPAYSASPPAFEPPRALPNVIVSKSPAKQAEVAEAQLPTQAVADSPEAAPLVQEPPSIPPPAAGNIWVSANPPASTGLGETSPRAVSPLASIITPSHTSAGELNGEVLSEIPTLPEFPLPAHADPVKAEVKPEFHPHLGLIYKARPAEVDDLTALKGVARTLEQRLHVLGVYTFEQIAGWTKDQVREFSARLAFKDRIEREQWVEQARELLAQKTSNAQQLG